MCFGFIYSRIAFYMKQVFFCITTLFSSAIALRDSTLALRATPVSLENVLGGKNLTAVVVGAKALAKNTIQVVLEANITPPPLTMVSASETKHRNATSIRIIYGAQDQDSIRLLKEGLVPFFTRPEILNVTSLQLVPFGRATEVRLSSLSTGFLYWHPELEKANLSAVYRCPHGEAECESSLIHACAITASGNDPKVYLPFIACMAGASFGTAPEDSSFSCSNSTLFMENIRRCALGPDGIALQHELAGIGSLVSRLPYVEIDGQSHRLELSNRTVGTYFTRFMCDFLFADGRIDRDVCEGNTVGPIIVPFQSILPSQGSLSSRERH